MMVLMRQWRAILAGLVISPFLAACPPPKPACDELCQRQQSTQAEIEQLEAEHQERRRELDEQTEQARLEYERQKLRLAEAQREREQTEAAALAHVNEARAKIGLPPISHWSNDQGGLEPDGALLIFGGRDHKTFLGCLCDEIEPDSVANSTGQFGPNGVGLESIWSKYGDYGSSYSDYSACNQFANHPPVVVSKDGRFYGYLTINRYKDKAITVEAVLDWLEKKVCNP